MKKRALVLACLLIACAASAMGGPLTADHTSTDIAKIPPYWIEKAKTDLRVTYGHTSHGSQIITGMNILKSNASYSSLLNYKDDYNDHILPAGALSLWDAQITGASDLGSPDRTAWAQATRVHLNGSGSDRNVVMWSWCGQVSTATQADINTYLSLMDGLERDYPNVKFIYMTGHLDGTGETGNLYQRNEQIRQYCKSNNKTLYDFADIESWDPAGNYYPDESDACGWCNTWCSSRSCPAEVGCAHSHCFNCYNKGKAFWHLMARLAGWNGEDPSATTTTSTTIATTSTSTFTTTQGTTTTSTIACPEKGNNPPCSEISLQEVVNAINQWITGGYTLQEVVGLINAWAA
jgi:hypothetical protein